MQIKIFTNKKNYISATIKFILNNLKNKKNYMALSGGNTPKEIYEALAEKLVSLKKSSRKNPTQLHFHQIDERYVHKTHSDSNQKMIRESFAKILAKNSRKISSPNSVINFHFFDTSLSIKKALKKYSEELPKNSNGRIKPFDLTILGIGPDGHIASLFPAKEKTTNFKALTTNLSVAHTTTKKFATKDRLTLTFPPVLKSKNILVLLQGKEKIDILKKLQNFQNSKITTSQIKNFPVLKLLMHKKLHIHVKPISS